VVLKPAPPQFGMEIGSKLRRAGAPDFDLSIDLGRKLAREVATGSNARPATPAVFVVQRCQMRPRRYAWTLPIRNDWPSWPCHPQRILPLQNATTTATNGKNLRILRKAKADGP